MIVFGIVILIDLPMIFFSLKKIYLQGKCNQNPKSNMRINFTITRNMYLEYCTMCVQKWLERTFFSRLNDSDFAPIL